MAEERSGPVATEAESAAGAAPIALLMAGQFVRIKRGLLAGSEGRVIERRPGERLLLSIEREDKIIRLDVPEEDIEPS